MTSRWNGGTPPSAATRTPSSTRPFAAELPGLDRDEIRSWYGGYRWAGNEAIYNPPGILRLCRERRFDGSWFDAAAPAFLIDMLMERGVDTDALDDRICDGQMLSLFDPDNVVMETLLFQTGCIPITGTEDLGGNVYYRLGYPHREVRRWLAVAGWGGAPRVADRGSQADGACRDRWRAAAYPSGEGRDPKSVAG